MPDRIAAATYLCAAASAGGEVRLTRAREDHLSAVTAALREAGCAIESDSGGITCRCDGRLRSIAPVRTAPYPGFPTDAQPVLMAALLKAEGRTVITENIFENRFRQVPELQRLGADIVVSGRQAEIWGVDCLRGSALTATDLRGGAAMLVAGLAAQGETTVFDDNHITRGYERFDMRLRSLGADIYLEC